MRLERTKNTKKNIAWGWANKIITTLFPFVIRTVIIQKLGVEYLGFNTLFSSVLSVLSLAELGFDSAVVFIMYDGVAMDDNQLLSTMLGFLKRVYFWVGTIILGAGIACIPFLPYLVKDIESVSNDINVYIIYSVFLVNTVVSYYFGGYRNCIINAYQRQDLVSKINSAIKIVSCFFQICILLLLENYYLYIITMPLFSIISNLLVVYVSKRLFPEIIPLGKMTYDVKKRLSKLIRGTFLTKLGGVLSHSFDDIIISSMIGLTVLAYYSNYALIYSSVNGFLIVIYNAMQGGVGNSIALESVEKNYNDLNTFTFLFNWIVGWSYICLILLFQPFIYLWVGKEGLLSNIVMIFIAIYFYCSLGGAILELYKTALGIWWEDRYRTIISSTVNLLLNIFFVITLRRFGEQYALLGIFVASILTHILIALPWAVWVTFKKYFKKGFGKYCLNLIILFIVPSIVAMVCWPLINLIPMGRGYIGLLFFGVRILFCIVVPNILYILVFFRTEIFKSALEFVCARNPKFKRCRKWIQKLYDKK